MRYGALLTVLMSMMRDKHTTFTVSLHPPVSCPHVLQVLQR